MQFEDRSKEALDTLEGAAALFNSTLDAAFAAASEATAEGVAVSAVNVPVDCVATLLEAEPEALWEAIKEEHHLIALLLIDNAIQEMLRDMCKLKGPELATANAYRDIQHALIHFLWDAREKEFVRARTENEETLKQLQTDLAWHQHYVRPPAAPNCPRTIKAIFDELRVAYESKTEVERELRTCQDALEKMTNERDLARNSLETLKALHAGEGK